MERVILHAGQPKTGTSAIQMFLAANREPLARAGYFYPATGAHDKGNHGKLIRGIIGQPVPPRLVDRHERLKEEIANNKPHTLIVSAEFLAGCYRKPEQRTRIMEYFCPLAPDICVIMYIRPDSDFLSSAYAQRVKTFAESRSFRDYVMAVSKRRYCDLLSLRNFPGTRAIFRPYDENVKRAGVVQDFVATSGLTAANLDMSAADLRVNESIGPLAVALARDTLRRIKSMGQIPTDTQCVALRTELFALMAQEPRESSFKGLDTNLLRKIEPLISHDRDEFAKEVWGKTWVEVFGSEEQRCQSNDFDPATADSNTMAQYQRLAPQLWAAAERIMRDEKLAVWRPWDRLHVGDRAGQVEAADE
jgi:hypothetical protein